MNKFAEFEISSIMNALDNNLKIIEDGISELARLNESFEISFEDGSIVNAREVSLFDKKRYRSFMLTSKDLSQSLRIFAANEEFSRLYEAIFPEDDHSRSDTTNSEELMSSIVAEIKNDPRDKRGPLVELCIPTSFNLSSMDLDGMGIKAMTHERTRCIAYRARFRSDPRHEYSSILFYILSLNL